MKNLFVILALTVEVPCLAQEVSRHAVSGEILGLGAIGISAQYDYMFRHSSKGFYDARAGLGGWYYPNSSSGHNAGVTVPHALTFNFGRKNHFVETGMGAFFLKEYNGGYYASSEAKYFLGPMAGYRSISAKGFQFRIYVNAFYGGRVGYKGAFYPSAGIGFGKVLGKGK